MRLVMLLLALGTAMLGACRQVDGGGDDFDAPGDSDADADSDADGDSDAESDLPTTECELALGGQCEELVEGCADCEDDASITPEPEGCPEGTWCCVPDVSKGPDDPQIELGCAGHGGVCIPLHPDVECPPGWETSEHDCAGLGVTCCVPGEDCP